MRKSLTILYARASCSIADVPSDLALLTKMSEEKEEKKTKLRQSDAVVKTNLCLRHEEYEEHPCVPFISKDVSQSTMEEWIRVGLWEETRRVGCHSSTCWHQCSLKAPEFWCYSLDPWTEKGYIMCNKDADCQNKWRRWRPMKQRHHAKCKGRCNS